MTRDHPNFYTSPITFDIIRQLSRAVGTANSHDLQHFDPSYPGVVSRNQQPAPSSHALPATTVVWRMQKNRSNEGQGVLLHDQAESLKALHVPVLETPRDASQSANA